MTVTVNSTLRPGLLVSLRTTLSGNITYDKRIIEAEHKTAEGVERAKWETIRTITDRAEHDAGRKAQAEARSCVTKVCTNTAFGLLCPEANRAELDKAVAEARTIADTFNETAQLSRIYIYIITGRVAPDDVEAVKAINNEVREMMKAMETGISNGDAEAIRTAANEAKKLGSMLSADAASRVQLAVDTARQAARKIVKAGETAAIEVDRASITRIAEARTAFLDMDGSNGEIAAPEAEGRALDLTPEVEAEEAPAPKRKVKAPAIEVS